MTFIFSGEHLYVQTSSDGRESIRQQLKNLKSKYDNFSKNLSLNLETLSKYNNQVNDLNVLRDNLASWLTKNNVLLNELSSNSTKLQDRKIKLEKLFGLHEEIINKKSLIDVFNEKIDEISEKSLRNFKFDLNENYENLLKHSSSIIVNVQKSIKQYENFKTVANDLKQWLSKKNMEFSKLNDVIGDKNELNERCFALKKLQESHPKSQQFIHKLKENLNEYCNDDFDFNELSNEFQNLVQNVDEHFQNIGMKGYHRLLVRFSAKCPNCVIFGMVVMILRTYLQNGQRPD